MIRLHQRRLAEEGRSEGSCVSTITVPSYLASGLSGGANRDVSISVSSACAKTIHNSVFE